MLITHSMTQKALFLLIISWLSLAGAGCLSFETVSETQPGPLGQVLNQQPVTQTHMDQSKPLPANMERRGLEFTDGRTINFILVKLPADEWQWSLENRPDQPKTVKRWREELGSQLVINGSYFNESQSPTGFYQTKDQAGAINWPDIEEQKNPSSYSSLVSITNGKLHLAYLPLEPSPRPAALSQVFLSFPTLIYNGQSLINEDSQKYARRTVLARDSHGYNYIILSESGVVSLYEMAEWLIQQPEQFNIAVNLDGGPSTGLSYQHQDQTLDIPSVAVPNIISLNNTSD